MSVGHCGLICFADLFSGQNCFRRRCSTCHRVQPIKQKRLRKLHLGTWVLFQNPTYLLRGQDHPPAPHPPPSQLQLGRPPSAVSLSLSLSLSLSRFASASAHSRACVGSAVFCSSCAAHCWQACPFASPMYAENRALCYFYRHPPLSYRDMCPLVYLKEKGAFGEPKHPSVAAVFTSASSSGPGSARSGGARQGGGRPRRPKTSKSTHASRWSVSLWANGFMRGM